MCPAVYWLHLCYRLFQSFDNINKYYDWVDKFLYWNLTGNKNANQTKRQVTSRPSYTQMLAQSSAAAVKNYVIDSLNDGFIICLPLTVIVTAAAKNWWRAFYLTKQSCAGNQIFTFRLMSNFRLSSRHVINLHLKCMFSPVQTIRVLQMSQPYMDML